ncbi:hypothetical protein [Cryobacterium glucosi]|uniref:PIN domain-containing protein n=1 Tax=Cryobacterium glucosi TaxID=1259175 RepID=A0ABY2IUU2_9MICO|nr:hypothetical protein [Cryobacterium glucosi]TFC23379.1 hypothetical protein E3O46_02090 [Cryobacterium glucosi]
MSGLFNESSRNRPVEPLRAITDSSGTGFCYDSDRDFFRDSRVSDGPLVVALDTNILIDFHTHGEALSNGDALPPSVTPEHAHELESLSMLIDIWMVRDIRFVPLTRSLTDTKKPFTLERELLRLSLVDHLANALTLQLEDWGQEADRWDNKDARRAETASRILSTHVPGQADRELVREACRMGADVFLTGDARVLRAEESLPEGTPHMMSPSQLLAALCALGVNGPFGGLLIHDGCAYTIPMPMGDSGKWAGLLSMFE